MGDRKGPFIVAECGINHGGSMERAISMIASAKWAGADAVKFQCFNAEKQSRGASESVAAWLQKSAFSEYQFDRLRTVSESVGIECFFTPFDSDWARWLAALKMPRVKIGSGQVKDEWMLQRLALTPELIISNGMADDKQIRRAIDIVSPIKATILYCVSQYPTPDSEIRLSEIDRLRKAFPGIDIGYSDHTQTVAWSVAAAMKGATVIEKHVRIEGTDAGPDHACSATFEEFRAMVREIRGVA